MKQFIYPFFLWLPLLLSAQLQDVLISPPEHIATVIATVNDYPYKYAIAEMGQPVFISFDDLDGDEKSYYYRIRRMDENWHETSLAPSEYIEGFDEDMIQNMENSKATLYSYTHYSFRLPNAQTQIKLPGNYLVEILDEDEEVLFNIPLVIYENRVPVSVQIKYPNQVDKMKTHQWVVFSLHTAQNRINYPAGLKILVLKNENLTDSRIFGLPTYDRGTSLEYRDPVKGLFPGGNEFRSFQSRDLRGYNPGVDSIRGASGYTFYLSPAYFFPSYTEYRDIDGSFIIHTKQGSEPHTEADYIQVVFRLHPDAKPRNKDIYVTGRFNAWRPGKREKLKLNPQTGFWETTLLLKQGHYDYYFVGKNPDGTLDWTAVSPSFSQTENRYTVLAYFREPGDRYYRIIGMGQAVSKPLR